MNRKQTIGLSALALAVVAAAGTAYAAQDDHPPMTRAAVQAHAAEMFARLDVNKDGKIDSADRAAHDAALFDAIDTNHDGSISRSEFAAMHGHGPRDDGPGMAGFAGGHHGDGPRGHHGRRGGGAMAMMMLPMADANHDGAVTQAELTAAMLAHFDRADTNHDGTLSEAERDAAHAAMRARMHQTPPPPPAGA